MRRWWLLLAGALAAGGVVGAALFAGGVPLPAATPAAQTSTVYADDGSTLALFHGTQDRTIVALSQISPNLQHAVIAAEDRTFYTDAGFSLRGTLRALWADVRGGSIAQGGSTITQEYVRGVFTEVGDKRTITRKLKEALLAVKFSRKYSKNQILSDYLNTVYFGRGAYGAQAAAEAYFGVSAEDLTVPEAAYLAGILRDPGGYDPTTNPRGATDIRDTVLTDMVQTGSVSSSQAGAFRSQSLPFVTDTSNSASGAYFVEYVRRLLEAPPYNLSDQEILTGGLKIYTTLDPKLQVAAENAVSQTLNEASDPQAALLSMSTNGSILAMVGGRNVTSLADAQGFNFATQQTPGSGRQAGSSFKPFTLAAFLQAGYSINSVYEAPATIEVTSKQCLNLDGSNWSVTNFDNESFPNDLDITQATANSVNTVYAQMVDMLTPKTVAATAQSIGGFTGLSPVCSITLGTSPVTPLDMARAYSTFATQGKLPTPLAVLKVVAPNGTVLINNTPQSTQVLDPNIANTINQVLSQVLVNGTAAGKGIGRPAAGKTGTTENLVDAWFVGYTPGVSTAVWMGYTNTNSSGQTQDMTSVHGIQVTGGTLPAEIWQKYMKVAVAGTPVQSFVAPTIVGKVIGPSGAPCPGGVSPTASFACVPPGTCQAGTVPVTPTGTATPGPNTNPTPGPNGNPTPGATSGPPRPGPTSVPTSPAVSPNPPPSPAASPGGTGSGVSTTAVGRAVPVQAAPAQTSPVNTAATPTAGATACGPVTQALPPDIVIPSPTPSPGSSPAPPVGQALGVAEPDRRRLATDGTSAA